MILADKIIELRKKNGWSQEELAEKVNVTRQSVSKWESALSIPDLDKILILAQIFGVTTDYLLKDELSEAEYTGKDGGTAYYRECGDEGGGESVGGGVRAVRKVSLAEANEFLAVKEKTAGRIALATFLCIVSPVPMIFMAGGADAGVLHFNEDKAGIAGLIIMLIVIAFAVAVFISCGSLTRPFEFLETENIETEYGVTGMVKERKNAYKEIYTRNNVIGTCLAILSVVPLFGAFLISESDFAAIVGVCLLLIMAGVGVIFFINGGIRWAGFEKLLEEGEYSRRNKAGRKGILGALSGAYWVLVTAVYLAVSLPRDNWDETWIIWPVAALIFVCWRGIATAVINRKNENL